jgi:iron complex outermembrane receptor protein
MARRGMRAMLFCGAALGLAQAAHAQDTPAVEEVVVTGSFIRGTPEDAALPVDVIGRDELERQGSPSTVDLIKQLPVSSGVLGDTNQFDPRANGAEGTGSINLRGLGAERTLVLLNGRRMANNPVVNGGGGVVDTNMIPSAAIARVEILKDGAAATYGSDAIGGVVNFITRTNPKGGELGADYRHIDGSDGDYNLSASYGWSGDRFSVFGAAGFQHRSELRVLERDFSNPTYLENPQGGYTAVGNPGSYIPLGPTYAALGAAQRDVNCAAISGTIGGFAGFSGATPVCYARSTQFDNLVERENRYQVFASAEYDLTDKVKAYGEVLYARTKVPERVTTPSQSLSQTPTVDPTGIPALAGRLFVPASNPGYAAYVAANPGVFPGTAVGAQLVSYRPLFQGGNPLFDGTGGGKDSRDYQAFRVSGGLKGDLFEGVGFDVNVTYSEDHAERTQFDVLVNRLQLALIGLGGAGCDQAPGAPGIQGAPGVGGCQYFNPFSTAIARNSATGGVNPQFNGSLANSADLVRWFYQSTTREAESRLLVADVVLNGALPWKLPGGDIGWAFGGQFRRDSYITHEDDLYNPDITPCLATPDFGVRNCASATGPFGFIGGARDVDLSGNVYALFGELSLPITDDFNVQLAARYEDYGGGVGSTFDPKVAVKWQATSWFGLRGSIGTTFRGPPLTARDSNPQTSLQQVRGIFRTVDAYGDPNLQPESAVAYNVGALVETGGLRASVDYWGFDFDNPVVSEPIGALASALYPTATTNRCQDAAYAAIRARFTFNDLNGNGTDDDCAAANIARVRTQVINASPVKTSGLDFSISYTWPDVLGGRVAIGADATWVLQYKIDAISIEGIEVSPAFEAVGKLNYQTTAPPMPEWRGAAYAEWRSGPHNLRWTMRYIHGYEDQRTDIYAPSVNNSATPGQAVALPQGKKIGRFVTHDVTYRTELPWDITALLTVENVFDEEPPFVRLNLSYDPFTANPLGRTVKVGLRKRF